MRQMVYNFFRRTCQSKACSNKYYLFIYLLNNNAYFYPQACNSYRRQNRSLGSVLLLITIVFETQKITRRTVSKCHYWNFSSFHSILMYRRSLRSLREELGRDSNPGLPDDQEGHIATPHPFLILKTNCAVFFWRKLAECLLGHGNPTQVSLENKMKWS
jgi:hypothetical protein